MNLLALSSSRAGGGGYLESGAPLIEQVLGPKARTVAFVPFASVDRDYEAYTTMVREVLQHLPHTFMTVGHHSGRYILEQCDAVMVGGGNTFKLLHDLYEGNLMDLIRQKVRSGIPYIGWSAGANLSGRSISTTNDMPIIQPKSFEALGFLPFQINPHYINQNTANFHGETRDQRISEFVKLNPGIPVVGLPEGTALRLEEKRLTYLGDAPGVVFTGGTAMQRGEIAGGTDVSYLMR